MNKNNSATKLKMSLMVCAALSAMATMPLTVLAQTTEAAASALITFNIPAQPLSKALSAFAVQAKQHILFTPDLVADKNSNGVTGSVDLKTALNQILTGTGLTFRDSNGTILIIKEKQDKNERGTADSAYVPEIAKVVVTANRREQLLFDVANSVSAIDGEKLEMQRSNSFKDYASQVPGLSVTSLSESENRITLRGLSAIGSAAVVSVYVDDAPLGSSTALGTGSLYSPNYDAWDVQRVEVLRGPQGTLYGANSEGGLIKFVSTAPNLQELSGAVQLDGQSVKDGQKAASEKIMINVPLIQDQLAFRISGYHEELPGYIYNPLLDEKNVDRGTKNGVRIGILNRVNSDLTLRLNLSEQRQNSEGQSYINAVGAATSFANPPSNQLSPSNGNSLSTLIAQPSNSTLRNAIFTADWDVGFGKLTSVSSYGENKNVSVQDSSFSQAPGTPPQYNITYSQALSSALQFPAYAAYDYAQTFRKYTEELRFATQLGDKFEWRAGIFATHESVSDYSHFPVGSQPGFVPVIAPMDAEITANNSTYKEYAVFTDGTYHLTPAVDLEAGVRYSVNLQDSLDRELPGFYYQVNSAIPGNSRDSSTTYSISPSWKIDTDSFLYTRIASGYRPGGPNFAPIGGAAPANFPYSYGPDRTTNYEVGFRTSLLDKKLTLDVAAFRIDWTNIQINERFGVGFSTANAGKAQSQGFEWNLGYHPLRGLTLTAVGSYTDAKLTADALADGGHSGDALPYAPKMSGSLDAEYRKPVGSGYNAFINAVWSYVGSEYTPFSSIPGYVEHVNLPGYDTASLHTGIDSEKWSLVLSVQNLTDKRAVTNYGSNGGANNTGVIQTLTPRTMALTGTYRF